MRNRPLSLDDKTSGMWAGDACEMREEKTDIIISEEEEEEEEEQGRNAGNTKKARQHGALWWPFWRALRTFGSGSQQQSVSPASPHDMT